MQPHLLHCRKFPDHRDGFPVAGYSEACPSEKRYQYEHSKRCTARQLPNASQAHYRLHLYAHLVTLVPGIALPATWIEPLPQREELEFWLVPSATVQFGIHGSGTIEKQNEPG